MKVLGYLLLSMFILGLVVNIMKALAILLVVLLLIAIILHPSELLSAMIFMGGMALIREYPAAAFIMGGSLVIAVIVRNWKGR